MGYYYVSLVYEDLSFCGYLSKAYGESRMKMMREKFLKWANRISETAADRNRVQYFVWIVPAPFAGMLYLNDGRYLPGDEVPEGESCKRNG